MKMVYETPKMKAELFQANQYVAACDSEYVVGYVDINLGETGMSLYDNFQKLIVQLKGTLTFRADSAVKSQNQVSGQGQWYFVYDDPDNLFENTVYLEWSAHKNQHVLYYEAGKDSGFYENTGTYRDPNYEQFFDGSSTLQTNNSYATDFHKPGGLVEQGTNYYYDFADDREDIGSTHADGWYADHCVGRVDTKFYDKSFSVVSS